MFKRAMKSFGHWIFEHCDLFEFWCL